MRSTIGFQGLLLTALLLQVIASSTASAQDIVVLGTQAQIVHDPERLVPCCVSVKCTGTNSYTVVKAMVMRCPEDIWSVVKAVCPNGYTVDNDAVDPEVCGLVDETVIIIDPLGKVTSSGVMAGGAQWKVHGYLCYCDGSTGRDLPTSGATYCEAVQKARKALCKMKDPCKRGYLKFCVTQSPCMQNGCVTSGN